jgi:protein required for attachment to host cells
MNHTCVIVADSKRARFFGVEAADEPRHRLTLVERTVLVNPDLEGARRNGAGRTKTERVSNRQAGDVHPIEAKRQQHELEIERRFAREIARHAGETTAGWKEGAVVLIAEPRLLGLGRHYVREALQPAVKLKEVAKNYAKLTAAELREQPGLASMLSIPGRPAG